MRLEQLITGNDEVQQHVAAEREKQALIVVSPMARKAIMSEIVPQLEENVTSLEAVDELLEQTKVTIEGAFKNKDPVYTRLISYKSIDQSDNQFLRDLLYVMDEWAKKTKKILDADDAPVEREREIKVKVEVESDINLTTEDGDNVSVQVKDASSDEEIPVSSAPAFEFFDMRF